MARSSTSIIGNKVRKRFRIRAEENLFLPQLPFEGELNIAQAARRFSVVPFTATDAGMLFDGNECFSQLLLLLITQDRYDDKNVRRGILAGLIDITV